MSSSKPQSIVRFFKRLVSRLRRFRFSKKATAKRASRRFVMQQVMSAKQDMRSSLLAQLRYFPRILSKTEKQIALFGIGLVLIGGAALTWQVINAQRVLAPAVGGEYTEGLIGAPQYINPLYAIASDVDTDLSRLIYSGLVRYDAVDGLVLDLAEDVTIASDGLSYTFTLRDDAVWHDGEPVTVDDIIFTYSAIQNPEYRSPLAVQFSSMTVDQLDHRNVRFTLEEPYAPFLSLLTIGILPSHIWQNVSPSIATLAEFNLKPIGSGPYQFDVLEKESSGTIRQYTLKRFGQYYDNPAYIEQLHFKFYADEQMAVEALKNHNIEGLSFVRPTDHEVIDRLQTTMIYEAESKQYTGLFFNQDHSELLADESIRQALSLATDKQEIVDDILGGFGRPIDSFVLPGMHGGDGATITIDSYDVRQANNILDEAGWSVNEGDFVRTLGEASDSDDETDEDLEELSFQLITLDDADLIRIAQRIEAQWREIGVEIVIEALTPQQFQTTVLENREYDIVLSGELYGIDPDFYAFWHSSQTAYPGLNLANYANDEADELIELGRTTTDPGTRADAYRELQTLITKERAAIFLFQPTYIYAPAEKIQGMDIRRISIPADRFSNITSWYLKTARILASDAE